MASDVVRIICPNLQCRALLSVPSSARGKTVRCRQCGARVRIPDAPPANVPKIPAAAPGANGQNPADPAATTDSPKTA